MAVFSAVVARGKNGTKNVFMETMVAFRDRVDESYSEYQDEIGTQRMLLMQKKGTMESLLNSTEAVLGRIILEKLMRVGR